MRYKAREIAVQLVYERCITGEYNDFSLTTLTEDFSDTDKAYTASIYNGACTHFDFINSVVERFSKAFKLERVYKVDLAILIVAAYEILFNVVPDAVAGNEAVELGKLFSTEKSYKYINGIISSIIKEKQALTDELNSHDACM